MKLSTALWQFGFFFWFFLRPVQLFVSCFGIVGGGMFDTSDVRRRQTRNPHLSTFTVNDGSPASTWGQKGARAAGCRCSWRLVSGGYRDHSETCPGSGSGVDGDASLLEELSCNSQNVVGETWKHRSILPRLPLGCGGTGDVQLTDVQQLYDALTSAMEKFQLGRKGRWTKLW